jgi:2-dehydropantoate 2-reductase
VHEEVLGKTRDVEDERDAGEGTGRRCTGMRILVAGTGALACVYAALLSRPSDHDVVVYGTWAEQLDAISASGITVHGPGDEMATVRVAVCRDPAELEAPFDLVVVATKGYQIAHRVSEIAHALDTRTIVFGVQNGLTPWDVLASAVDGRAVTLAGESMVAATKAEAGEVHLFSLGETILAPGRGLSDPEAVNRAAAILRAADLPVRVLDAGALTKLLWEKAILTAGLNAVSILLRVPVSGIRRSAAASKLTRGAMSEVRDVAGTRGITLDVDAAFASTEAFGDNRPSGLQDFLAGRPTEVADINGAVAEYSRAAGLTAPINEVLHTLVAALYETTADRIPDPNATRTAAVAREGASL